MEDVMESEPTPGSPTSDEEVEEVEVEEEVESLVKGRERRSTAGLNMSALINAAADDDLTLLFEEVEDDNEFAMGADVDDEDVALDSSSDDDDQGPNAQNEYEGEDQLQKEERKKRRTQNDLRFNTLRKRVKIDPTAIAGPAAPLPRPKKKSERISWLPTVEDGPIRASSRRQTMVNKELTHARLQESQEKRIRIIATMEEAAKRKAHLKPKEMTQEDHLNNAARMERLNSKSVNRWEKREKEKAEERRAKIEALQNRRLEGPVISYWSGVATWVNGQLTKVGKADIVPKTEKDVKSKPKKAPAAPSVVIQLAEKPSAEGQVQPAQPVNTSTDQFRPILTGSPGKPVPTVEISCRGSIAQSTKSDKQAHSYAMDIDTDTANADATKVDSTPPANTDAMEVDSTANASISVTQSVMGPASLPVATSADTPASEVVQATSTSTTVEHDKPKPDTAIAATPLAHLTPQASPVPSTNAFPLQATQPETSALASLSGPTPPIQSEIHGAPTETLEPAAVAPAIPPTPQVTEYTGRQLTILENFDDKTAHSKKYSMYFNAKRPPKLTSKSPTPEFEFESCVEEAKTNSSIEISASLCVITSLPPRYRDPETGLPYANSYAYGQIRKLLAEGYTWSSMLGCFVGGPASTVARGVPERFLGKPKSNEEKEATVKEVARLEGEKAPGDTSLNAPTGEAANTDARSIQL
ncbi:YL1 nuclear C-terminal [Penicillium taxi]|uniref:YL1 nuclear C-terminal n=1 Tax=Penicillium taxi TaxID=168475 RepID=UPI00254562DE|nr:YL1 nuclear C-terminal [Penicillium taxi]KAJ5894504.1 YL1 nuclear C-terminal [Penicillium taxi]